MTAAAPHAPAPNAPRLQGDPVAVDRVRRRVAAALAGAPPGSVLLAVSGGRDSMALLDAAAAVAHDRLAGVATFDHGTGLAARRAVRLVRRVAGAHGLRVVVDRAELAGAGEAGWRAARWRFLRRAARQLGAASVATGHTEDDQVETVVLALLRGAGPRGLAALLVPRRRVRRPLLGCPAATVRAYAVARRLRWVEDPSNAVLDARRNRVRHELLPALCTVRPGLRGELLALGARAAAWRRDVAALVAALPVAARADGTVDVPVAALAAFDAPALAVVWPPLVARLGASADRRGIARLVAFTRAAAERPRGGARAQLAGGVEVRLERTADGWHLVLGRAQARHRGPDASIAREWQLEPATPSAGRSDADPWVATLPAGCAYLVRPWRPGDRLVRAAAGGAPRARRVKRYLAEARIAGDERARWPVVVAFGADGREASVVWIPGLSRGAPAPAGPDDGPAATFRCARRNGADLVPATAPVPRDAA